MATDPNAAEQGQDPGVFTFTATGGDLTQALTVSYTIDALLTATSSDYSPPLTGSIVIPANQASTTLTITPVDDSISEPDETLMLDIAANPNSYLLGTPTSATVTIVNDAPPTISIGAPSASYATGGPITYAVTYADANFNASTLAAGNITLNKTGTANGTLAVTGSGLTRTVTISSITGDGSLGILIAAGTASDLAGNLAPAAGPSATFTVDNTAPTISIGSPVGHDHQGRADHLHRDLRRCELQRQHLGGRQRHAEQDGHGQWDDRRHRHGPDPHGHHQQHQRQRQPGDFDRRRHGLGPGRQPGPGRRPQRDLHRGQHRADDFDWRPRRPLSPRAGRSPTP